MAYSSRNYSKRNSVLTPTPRCAACHAALAGLAGHDGAGVSTAEGKAQIDKAMTVLRKAVDTGFRAPNVFRTETALDPLRGRDDCKKLLEELEKKSPAKPEKQTRPRKRCDPPSPLAVNPRHGRRPDRSSRGSQCRAAHRGQSRQGRCISHSRQDATKTSTDLAE